MGRELLNSGDWRIGRGSHARSIAARILIAALSAATLGLSVLDIKFALAETGGPIAEEALVRGQESAWIVRAASPMNRCLATWDRTSGMSKRQWKTTCKRVVKENPGLYSKPF